MAKYTFKWPHSAENVIVTGSFDDWSKSVTLDKVGDSFEKTVDLPDFADKIQYKYVVDGEWKTNSQAPTEDDGKGSVNNVLTPEEIVKSAPATTALLSSAAPASTTAALAAGAPVETKKEADTTAPGAAVLSSAAPTSTTADLAKDAPLEKKAADKSDVPGSFPETPFETPLEQKEIGINPLPAADGGLNPIKLAPGEPIPKEFAAASTTSHVKLDKESYEKSDALPGVPDLPPVSKNMIPESSLPIVSADEAAAAKPTISSAAPTSTTAGLAAAVPLEAEEPNVPEVVKESQEKAGVDPEASGMSDEVKEKEKVEDELLSKVPEVPSTSEGTAGKGTEKAETDKTLLETVAATVTGLGAAAVATAVATKDTVTQQATAASTQATETATEAAKQLPEGVKSAVPEQVKSALPVSVQDAIAPTTKEEVREEVAPQVPAEVKESITEAGKSPEAAANTEAVLEKKAVETELLKEVKPVPAAAGEKAPAKAELNGTDEAKDAAPVKAAAAEPATTTEAATSHPAATPADAAAATTSTSPEETHPAAAPAAPATATGGESSKAAEETPAATAAKKKKNRLSAMFGKVKSKLSSKDK